METETEQESISLLDRKAIKEARKVRHPEDVVVSARVYNLLIGAIILYGFAVNVLMVKYFTPILVDFFYDKFLLFFIIYAVFGLFGMALSCQSKSPWVSFLGYNMLVVPLGVVMAVAVHKSAPDVVLQACVITGLLIFVMMLIAVLFPRQFSDMRLGTILFIGLSSYLVARIFCMIFQFYPPVLIWIGAGLFTVYIGYDWARAQTYEKTVDHAVDSALDIYLDITALFLKLLKLLKKSE